MLSRSSPLYQLKKCREGDLHFLVWSQDCQLKKCRVIPTCLASGRRNCLVSCCGTCSVTFLCQLWKMEIVSSLVELDLSVAFYPNLILTGIYLFFCGFHLGWKNSIALRSSFVSFFIIITYSLIFWVSELIFLLLWPLWRSFSMGPRRRSLFNNGVLI